MNLLLLLSALLSALTGAGVSARAAQPAVAVARPVTAAGDTQATVRPEPRPVAALPGIQALAAVAGIAWRLAPAAPLFLSRRRE